MSTQLQDSNETDAALRHKIDLTLLQRGVSAARQLDVDVVNGIVTVAGEAPTFYQRQLIVHSIRRVSGVVRVIDRIDVFSYNDGELSFTTPALLTTSAPTSHFSTRSRLQAAVAVAAVALLMASCSKQPDNQIPVFPVQGKLTLDGEAAPGAFLVLHPVGRELPKDATPKARVGQDGTFKVGTYSAGDGAPEGEYVLTAEWKKLVTNNGDTLPGPNVLPAELSKKETSTLRVKVSPGKNEWAPLQLTSAASEEGSAQ